MGMADDARRAAKAADDRLTLSAPARRPSAQVTFEDFRWWTERYSWWKQAGHCVTLFSNITAARVLAAMSAESSAVVRGVAELSEPAFETWDDTGGDALMVGVADLDGWALMVEVNGYVGVTDRLIEPLARGRVIVSHFQNVNAVDRFTWWRDGKVALTFEPLFPDQRSGATPDVLIDSMREVGFPVDGSAYDDGEFHQSEAAFALAERVTAVRIGPEVLDGLTYHTGRVRMTE